MPRMEPMNATNRFLPFTTADDAMPFKESGRDMLVQDERAIVSRASLVESKLAALCQRADQYLRRSRIRLGSQ
jgi:hypothetical protein